MLQYYSSNCDRSSCTIAASKGISVISIRQIKNEDDLSTLSLNQTPRPALLDTKQSQNMRRSAVVLSIAPIHTLFSILSKKAALRTMGKGKNRHRKRRGAGGGGGKKKGRNDDTDANQQDRRGGFVPMQKGNFKMECFYALQRLHHQRWDENSACLVECTSDEEREEERRKWRHVLGEILPASFRITKDAPIYLQTKLEQELQTLLREATEYQPEKKDNDRSTQKVEAGSQAAPISNEDPRRAPLAASEILSCRRLPFLQGA